MKMKAKDVVAQVRAMSEAGLAGGGLVEAVEELASQIENEEIDPDSELADVLAARQRWLAMEHEEIAALQALLDLCALSGLPRDTPIEVALRDVDERAKHDPEMRRRVRDIMERAVHSA